jgi:hypothetical protein
MKRKKSLIVFSTTLLLVLLAVSLTSTSAALTNNWGVDEGTTLNYTIEETYGDHKESNGFEVTIETVADLDTPSDDLADLFYTYESRSEDGEVMSAGKGTLSGNTIYSFLGLIFPFSLPIFVYPVSADGGAGFDWSTAKTGIESLGGYDEITVTESGDTFKAVLTYSADAAWGSLSKTIEAEWDKGEGVLKYYLEEYDYDEVDMTDKTEITEGELSEGFLEGNAPIIAAAALGLAFLAFLMVLVKK